jgi:Skp family chaperone for outer membrane proteins
MSFLPIVALVSLLLCVPSWGQAFEAASPLTDREIIERLTRLEEGQNALQEGQNALQEGQNALRAEIQQLRREFKEDLKEEIRQLRTDINAQFAWMTQLILGQLGAFAMIVVFTIGFALWDRKTMTRPLENRLKVVEEEIAQNRPRLHSLVEALRALSKQDSKVAEVLKQFDLL